MSDEKKYTHTPGPWRIAGKGTIRKGDTDWIADVHWRNREANARLIAAAPALLAELERMTEHFAIWAADHSDESTAETWAIIHCARSAISQALGGE